MDVIRGGEKPGPECGYAWGVEGEEMPVIEEGDAELGGAG
jgi:hypothetical protein